MICDLPKKVGPYRAGKPRYYYNSQQNNCVFFLYGGCRGNQNNFRTIEGCEAACKNYI